jgi:carboxylesterase 1
LFWHGIQRVVQSRVKYGTGKTFLYRFDVESDDFLLVKKFMKCEDFKGSGHGDDLLYLFKHDGHLPSKQPAIDSKEFEMIKKMVAIYTSFAINGDPNTFELGDCKWDAVESIEIPLKCFNINQDLFKMIKLPESDRLLVWDAVYNAEGVDLY